MQALGIDIGGSGIKAAPVDTVRGELLAERRRIVTPRPATPEAVAEVVARLTREFDWSGPIGCAFPGVVRNGIVMTAANVHEDWVEDNGEERLGEVTGCPVTMINDADAAGMAEMAFGAGQDRQGVVIMLTLGTGIGSAIFVGGHLLPNTEFGHMEIGKKSAEQRASDRARQSDDLSWRKWAARLSLVMQRIEALIWPDLFIIGGGVSKKHERFLPLLETRTEVVPARLRNDAGIVGAAMAGAGEEPALVQRQGRI